jgi:hypothetical protein
MKNRKRVRGHHTALVGLTMFCVLLFASAVTHNTNPKMLIAMAIGAALMFLGGYRVSSAPREDDEGD